MENNHSGCKRGCWFKDTNDEGRININCFSFFTESMHKNQCENIFKKSIKRAKYASCIHKYAKKCNVIISNASIPFKSGVSIELIVSAIKTCIYMFWITLIIIKIVTITSLHRILNILIRESVLGRISMDRLWYHSSWIYRPHQFHSGYVCGRKK